MNGVRLIVSMVITSLLLAVSQVGLLALIFRPDKGMAWQKRAALFVLAVLLCTLARCLETMEGLARYASWLMLLAVLSAAAVLWTRARGNMARGVAQRVLCFFLLTEGATLGLSYLCVTCIGVDPVRGAGLPVQVVAIMAQTALFALLLMLAWRRFPPEICADASSLQLGLLSAMPYLFCSQITYWLPVAPIEVPAAVPMTMAVSCVLAYLLITSMEQRLYAEKERHQALAQKHMAELRQQQYVCRRDSMETVRRYYHDMKNLLLYLERTTSGREEIKAQVRQIIEDTRDYETILDTGNEAADILLSEKMTLCTREGISCSAMVDGALLSFIAEIDLVTILGNVLDNAIEARLLMPRESARYVHIRTRETPGFILLHAVNSCTGQARMQDGRFLSLKKDAENHGLGLSSIQRAAEKYGGEMACSMEDGEFSLSLVFPRGETDPL